MDGRVSVIMDNGSSLSKIGLANSETPKYIFPTIVGKLNNKLLCKNEFYGDDAISQRSKLNLSYPIERGTITNWDNMERIWNYSFEKLQVASDGQPVVLTDAPLNPRENREKMAEILFEKFNTPLINISNTAILSLFHAGLYEGIVLESGDGISSIYPVFDGLTISDAVKTVNMAGKDLTNYLHKILTDKGHALKTESDIDAVREIKEKLCCVSEQKNTLISGSASNDNYELPDGQIINLTHERFSCPEALFDPSLLGLDYCGIHKTIYDSIMMCDIGIRRMLYANIILSGGSVEFKGMDIRLKLEIEALAPPTVKIEVHKNLNSKLSAYLGGKALVSLPNFDKLCTSKQNYEEYGPSIIIDNIIL